MKDTKRLNRDNPRFTKDNPRRNFSAPEEEENEGQIEGRNALTEALRSGRTIDKVFIASGETDRALQHLAAQAKHDVSHGISRTFHLDLLLRANFANISILPKTAAKCKFFTQESAFYGNYLHFFGCGSYSPWFFRIFSAMQRPAFHQILLQSYPYTVPAYQ